MLKQSILIAAAVVALFSGSLAHAKKDGATQGGMSPQHMSQQGRESANNPLMGQESGAQRSMERMNQQGREHGRGGMMDNADDRGNAKGHDKNKAQGKAKGHYK